MKKILLSIILLIVSSFAFSQFSLGIKAGTNFSSLSSVSTCFNSGSIMRSGFEVGAFARVGERFYVQPELLYAMKVVDVSGNVAGYEYEYDLLKLQYVSIPVLFGFKIIDKNCFNFRLFLGPQFDVVLGTDYRGDGYNGVDFNDFVVGGRAGLGMDIWRFTLDASYNLDLTNLAASGSGSIKINGVNVGVGFKIFK